VTRIYGCSEDAALQVAAEFAKAADWTLPRKLLDVPTIASALPDVIDLGPA
jgi:hypothetical protein